MYIGIDIGGTKCAVIQSDESMNITGKIKMDTGNVNDTLERIFSAVESFGDCDAIGVSCGGPLDEGRGIICSPPNLPGWDDIHITEMLRERFKVPAFLRNDANACALAEWQFGAGVGTRNMVFLTFGTGMGAGLILNGALYGGTNGNAGEVGHMRMERFGPTGYGKMGSFEGFCSGGGIRQIAISKANQRIQQGLPVSYMKTDDVHDVTTKDVAEACKRGEADALEVMALSGHYLGVGLSYVIDILNPEKIVIGSVFARAGEFLIPEMEKVLLKEALAPSLSVCKVVPASLGEKIGDYGAVVAALDL